MLLLWDIFLSKRNYMLWVLLVGLPLFGASQVQPKRACIARNGADVQISWHAIQDTCNQFTDIEILARPNNFTPFGSIALLTNPLQTNYTHIGAANTTSGWSYAMVYRYACDSIVFRSDTLYLDLIQPNQTVFDSVSYDPVSGGMLLGWTGNSAPDLAGYYLWRSVGTNNTIFDSVSNRTDYLDLSRDPQNGQLFYTITAYDSCFNQSVISNSQAAPFLQLTSKNCGHRVRLNWLPYVGHGTQRQELYIKLNGADYAIESNLAAGINSYDITLEGGDVAEFYVRAFLNNGASSRSNPVNITVVDTFVPDKNLIHTVDWVNPNEFELHGKYDSGIDFDSVSIEKLVFGNYEVLWKGLTSDNPYPFLIEENDTFVHYYRQKLTDRCGRVYYSELSHNLVLKGEEAENQDQYRLNWNPATYFPSGVESYEIRLGENPIEYLIWTNIESNLSDTFYTATVEDLTLNRRCFQVYAEKSGVLETGEPAQVKSNPYCFILEPEIYFPNAIVPRGTNKEFKPVGVGIDYDNSYIQIFARNGQLVYEHNMTSFWKGEDSQNDYYPIAVYIYKADVRFLNGDRKSYTGNLSIIH